MRRVALPVLALALVLSLLPSSTASGDPERDSGDVATVLLTFTVADHAAERGETTRIVHLRALDGSRTRLQTGWRLPVPTATVNSSDPEQGAITSFQYQDVGLTVAVQCRVVAGDRVRLSGRLDISAEGSAARASGSSTPPTLSTLGHQFEVALTTGTDTLLAQVPGPDGGEITLSVRTAIER